MNVVQKIRTTLSGRKVSVDAAPAPGSSELLVALSGKPQIYAGTANPKTVAQRRAKNKVARASRRANR